MGDARSQERPIGLFGAMQSFLHRKGRPVWPLTVRDKEEVAPPFLRVHFHGDTLDAFVWRRGQDLVLELPQPDSSIARRHYTVRSHDAKERSLTIDFVLHHDSPASRWARMAKAGDTIEAVGPRGRTVVRNDADWHLFLGDETSVPGIFAMLEGLSQGSRAFAFLEIGQGDRRLAPASEADVNLEWISRDGLPAGPNRVLLSRVERFDLPAGRGHAYITGETSNVRALRHHLIARGFPREQIAAEGYWRPGRIGGHDHV